MSDIPAERLFSEGFAFDFFQAVRLLEWLQPDRVPVGRDGPPQAESVRFRAVQSLAFPASSIVELESVENLAPRLTVAFLGLTGPTGALPRHYTELVMRLERDGRSVERHVLRDWLDLFNHRLTSLFVRAWEKYRLAPSYERSARTKRGPDPITETVYSLFGLGQPPLRNRLTVMSGETELARIDDLGLIRCAGLLAHRPRSAAGLQRLLAGFFGVSVEIRQFQGRWLQFGDSNRTRLGERTNGELGVSVVIGDRVWDVQTKFRVVLGPLSACEFHNLLPDRTTVPQRKAFFLLGHLVRLYVGQELDFDVQLVLRAAEVPPLKLDGGARLGWDTWLDRPTNAEDATEAVFEAIEF